MYAVTVRRVCESDEIHISGSFTNVVIDEGVTKEQPGKVADPAQNEEYHIVDLKLLRKADRMKWHSLLLKDGERAHYGFAMAPIITNDAHPSVEFDNSFPLRSMDAKQLLLQMTCDAFCKL